MGCGKDECQSLYAPGLEAQRFCRWCRSWFHIDCLDGQLEKDEAAQRLMDQELKLVSLTGKQSVALAPVQRGLDDVVGPIQAVMAAFENNDETSGDAVVPTWKEMPMYACPCGEGFL
jgi:hypothetical protein